jgi:hypothetical protein
LAATALFTEFAKMKNEAGASLFWQLHMRSVCEECVASGTLKADPCPHAHLLDPPFEQPPWMAEEDLKNLARMYAGSVKDYFREIAGANATDSTKGTSSVRGLLPVRTR